MADLLGELTAAESDRLWWRLVRAMSAVADEIDALELAPQAVRDGLYGAGCLGRYRGLLGELADLAGNDVHHTAATWADMLAGHLEEREAQWHDSGAHQTTRPATWAQLATRVSLTRALRRLTPQK